MRRTREVVTPAGTTVRRRPVVGDLHWDGERWRRWSGRRWARAAYSLHPERLTDPARVDHQPRVEESGRQRALALAVEDQVVGNGASVVHEGPGGVVLGYRRPVAHVAHAVMTVITGGLWALVWLAAFLRGREDRIRLEADAWGHVWARPVASG